MNLKRAYKNMFMYDPYLGREYGVLPRWLQFIIFINQGLYRGGVGQSGWLKCWRWSKLKRINCWNNNHTWFYHTAFNRKDCTRCGEQENTINLMNIKSEVKKKTGYDVDFIRTYNSAYIEGTISNPDGLKSSSLILQGIELKDKGEEETIDLIVKKINSLKK